MSSQSDIETTKESHRSEHVDIAEKPGNGDILVNKDVMHDAFDGENREHEMGVWEAVQTYPWACFWAFIMCFTIVSAVLALPRGYPDAQKGACTCVKLV